MDNSAPSNIDESSSEFSDIKFKKEAMESLSNPRNSGLNIKKNEENISMDDIIETVKVIYRNKRDTNKAKIEGLKEKFNQILKETKRKIPILFTDFSQNYNKNLDNNHPFISYSVSSYSKDELIVNTISNINHQYQRRQEALEVTRGQSLKAFDLKLSFKDLKEIPTDFINTDDACLV